MENLSEAQMDKILDNTDELIRIQKLEIILKKLELIHSDFYADELRDLKDAIGSAIIKNRAIGI